jgi:hypothetical protein
MGTTFVEEIGASLFYCRITGNPEITGWSSCLQGFFDQYARARDCSGKCSGCQFRWACIRWKWKR